MEDREATLVEALADAEAQIQATAWDADTAVWDPGLWIQNWVRAETAADDADEALQAYRAGIDPRAAESRLPAG